MREFTSRQIAEQRDLVEQALGVIVHRRPLAQLARDFGDGLGLGLGFDVERPDAGADGRGDLFARFADAGEDHLARIDPRRQAARQFAARNDVEPRPLADQRAQDGGVGV